MQRTLERTHLAGGKILIHTDPGAIDGLLSEVGLTIGAVVERRNDDPNQDSQTLKVVGVSTFGEDINEAIGQSLEGFHVCFEYVKPKSERVHTLPLSNIVGKEGTNVFHLASDITHFWPYEVKKD